MDHQALIQDLRRAGSLPDEEEVVAQRETHVSTVLLTRDHAWKLKKPRDLGFLDYSTLEARRRCCEQELALNRRLSDGVYLDVLPVRRDRTGRCRVDGEGPVVDWAVKMRRLDDAASLEQRILDGQLGPDAMGGLAGCLADFHELGQLEQGGEHFGDRSHIAEDWKENFDQMAALGTGLLSQAQARRIRRAVERFLDQHSELLARRVRQRRIRDCHGDLRAEHVYRIESQWQIIDCIEFNERFRRIDVASELAFLVMDLDRLGASSHAEALVRAYLDRTGDMGLPALLPFYCCYRAWVRGKVSAFERPEDGAERKQSASRATAYFALSERYARVFARPTVYLTTGLIGSGKSTLARGLAEALELRRIATDHVRKDLAGLAARDRVNVAFGEGLYSAEQTAETYRALLAKAQEELARGNSVVLDGAFPLQAQRSLVAKLARETAARCVLLECRAGRALTLKRLRERAAAGESASDGRVELYEDFRRNYEEVRPEAGMRYLRVDMSPPRREAIRATLLDLWLLGRSGSGQDPDR